MPNTRKILIVDDDPGLRDALTEQLSLHEEFEVLAVENGSKGVPAAKAGQIDLVIMDVGLPDIDGREILRKNGHARTPFRLQERPLLREPRPAWRSLT
jgi:DNA-binding response OmpR family regulator